MLEAVGHDREVQRDAPQRVAAGGAARGELLCVRVAPQGKQRGARILAQVAHADARGERRRRRQADSRSRSPTRCTPCRCTS